MVQSWSVSTAMLMATASPCQLPIPLGPEPAHINIGEAWYEPIAQCIARRAGSAVTVVQRVLEMLRRASQESCKPLCSRTRTGRHGIASRLCEIPGLDVDTEGDDLSLMTCTLPPIDMNPPGSLGASCWVGEGKPCILLRASHPLRVASQPTAHRQAVSCGCKLRKYIYATCPYMRLDVTYCYLCIASRCK